MVVNNEEIGIKRLLCGNLPTLALELNNRTRLSSFEADLRIRSTHDTLHRLVLSFSRQHLLPAASTSPVAGSTRARVVSSFYLGIALVGFWWHAISQENNDVWHTEASQELSVLFGTALLGLLFGLLVVLLFRVLESYLAWLPELHREFHGILGRPRIRELLLLAAASALGEEILFRGAMLDSFGIGISSLIFAILHIPPRLSLFAWTLSAGLLGLTLAFLTQLTGNLGAAVAAHFIINFLNLTYITRHPPGIALRGPVQPR